MRRILTLGVMLALMATGCVDMPGEPPAAAVLAGDWVSIDLDDLEVKLTFDENGILTRVEATRPSDMAVAVLNPLNATSDVDSNAVTVTVPTANGSSVYSGTLSADQNMLMGTLSSVIDIQNGFIVIPQGDLDLVRDTNGDPCADVVCTNGETCVDGACVPDDPCADVVCSNGETCVDGACVADDPCADVVCSNGETCVDGVCIVDDPCADVVCSDGETCVEGVCVPDAPAGDAQAGMVYYDANCAGCHGADASGGFGPNIQGFSAAELQAGVEGAEIHDTISITAEDYANLEAYLATLP